MKNTRKLFFIVSVDTECDKSPDWSVRYPFEFRNIREGLGQLLQPVFNACGAKPTYLLSPEVITDESSADFFRRLGSSAELGTHLHGEYVEPHPNFAAKYTEDFQCDYAPDLERMKLANLTRMFSERFHYQPLSFRAGRFGMSAHTLTFLSELGYAVDSSLFPYARLQTKRGHQNFFSCPSEPFLGRTTNNTGEAVLEVPMTVMSRVYSKMPVCLRVPISNSPSADAVVRKICGSDKVKTWSLRPSTYDFARLREIIDCHIRHTQSENVFLNMMFHSNEIVPGCSPYSADENDVRRILGTLEQTLQYAKALGASFIGLSEARDVFINSRRNA